MRSIVKTLSKGNYPGVIGAYSMEGALAKLESPKVITALHNEFDGHRY